MGDSHYKVNRGQEFENLHENEVTTKAILAGLCETSTSHGFPQICNAPGTTKRVIWFVILAGMVASLIYNLEQITSKFFTYDVQASVYIHTVNKQKFPAVTLCNMSPFKMSLVAQNEDISAILGVDTETMRIKRDAKHKRTVKPKDTSNDGRKRKRRYIAAPNCNSDNFDNQTGSCFALATVTPLFGPPGVGNDVWENHLTNCEREGWDLAVLDSNAKFDYIASHASMFTGVMDDTSTPLYWLKMRYVGGVWRWGQDTTDPMVSFAAWDQANGMPVDGAAYPCAYANISNGHLWSNGNCIEYRMGLCEKSYASQETSVSELTSLLETSPTESTSDQTSEILTTPAETPQQDSTSAGLTTSEIQTTKVLTSQLHSTYVGLTTSETKTTAVMASQPDIISSGPATIDIDGTVFMTSQEEQNTFETTSENTDSVSTGSIVITNEGSSVSNGNDETTYVTSSNNGDVMNTEETTMDNWDTFEPMTEGTNEIPSAQPPHPQVTTPVYEPYPTPAPVPGSAFPDRVLQDDDFLAESIIYESLSNIDDEIKKTVGFQMDQFIIDCQYAGYPCYPWQFSYFYNHIHGNCYIFNSGWNQSEEVKWSYHVGSRYALKVVLNIEQDEYVRNRMGQAAGVRVVVHDQLKMPFPEEEGVLAQPGFMTSIGVQKITIHRKGEPYTSCINVKKKNLKDNVYEEHYPVKYTNMACYKTCYQRNVIKQCGCAFAGLPMRGEAFGNREQIHACSSTNIEQDDCLYNVSRQYALNMLECDCKNPCSEEYYPTEVSHSRWPADKHVDAFLSDHTDQLWNLINDSDSKKYQDNLAKVEVYFETFQYEKVVEIASYKDLVYISDVGGSFGLWIGWSFITAFEFVEFLFDIVVQILRRRFFNKGADTKQDQKKSLHDLRVCRKRKERRKNAIDPRVPREDKTLETGEMRESLDSGLSSTCSMTSGVSSDQSAESRA